MPDGARSALLGYLYQLLGTASLTVREVSCAGDVWARLVARAGGGTVLCEEFASDATVRPTSTPSDGVTAIQFKYSSSSTAGIDRDDLIDILVAFDRSRREALSEGVGLTQYALVTNRQLGPKAQAILDHRTATAPHRSLQVTTTRNGEPVAQNVRRLEAYAGDSATAAAAWHQIVQQLEVVPAATFEDDLLRLRQFARRYGVLDGEWARALDSLIGAFVRETALGRTIEVTREWLKTQVIGDSAAANLQFGSHYPPHISERCLETLHGRTTRQHRIPAEFYLVRRVQQELQAALEQHPVVFVVGGGGCGKSLAVATYLRSVADEQLVWSEGALTASETTIVSAVTTARLPGRHGGGGDRCLADVRRRLETANASRRPLWTIDLDGVDEAPGRAAELRQLINICWARGSRDASPASLVVTYRHPTGEDIRDRVIGEWLDTPEPDLVTGVGFAELGNFHSQELVEAARLLLGTPERRIIQTVDVTEGGLVDQLRPVPEEVLRMLQHPVVWGEYASLPEAHRNGILDQNQSHLAHLTKRLYRRFLLRCQGRRLWRDNRLLEQTLPAVARVLPGGVPHLPESWNQACEPLLDREEARVLYHECLSYGIVERDSGRRWRWAHRFLVEYLTTPAGGGASE